MQTSSPIVDNLIENLSSGAQRLGAPLEEKWLHSWSGALTWGLCLPQGEVTKKK